VHVVAWVALESENEKLKSYLVMQCIKESSTLRISSKKEKASPRIVFRYGKQNCEIKNFLAMRSFVRSFDSWEFPREGQDEHETIETLFRNIDLGFAKTVLRDRFHTSGQ
jgi:hypothetical protein